MELVSEKKSKSKFSPSVTNLKHCENVGPTREILFDLGNYCKSVTEPGSRGSGRMRYCSLRL